MKFFTPERYADFNSADPSAADRADRQWEQALSDYGLHLKRIGNQLPPRAREFAERTCLHDAEYLGFSSIPAPRMAASLAVVAVRKADEALLLIYIVTEEPSFSEPIELEVFSPHDVHWLYDEFDASDKGGLSHEILLSNGRVLRLRFVAFDALLVAGGRDGAAAEIKVAAGALRTNA